MKRVSLSKILDTSGKAVEANPGVEDTVVCLQEILKSNMCADLGKPSLPAEISIFDSVWSPNSTPLH